MQLHTDCRDLSPEKLKQCLEFARDWNTNLRRCHAAQAMLQAIILEHPPQVWQTRCPLLLSRCQSCQHNANNCHGRLSQIWPWSCSYLTLLPVVSGSICAGATGACSPQERARTFIFCMQKLRAIPGVGAVVDALSAYTERHLARLDRLRRSVRLLDYTLGCMHVLEESSVQACSPLVLLVCNHQTNIWFDLSSTPGH